MVERRVGGESLYGLLYLVAMDLTALGVESLGRWSLGCFFFRLAFLGLSASVLGLGIPESGCSCGTKEICACTNLVGFHCFIRMLHWNGLYYSQRLPFPFAWHLSTRFISEWTFHPDADLPCSQ